MDTIGGRPALRTVISTSPQRPVGSDSHYLGDLGERGLVGLFRSLALGILGTAQEKAAAAAADEHGTAALIALFLEGDRFQVGRGAAAGPACSASLSLRSSGMGAVPRHLG